MSEKTFPLNKAQLEQVIAKYPTPFHIYDEKAIRNNIRKLQQAFSWAPSFKEHFAVKATPNPRLIQLLAEEGAGKIFDGSKNLFKGIHGLHHRPR